VAVTLTVLLLVLEEQFTVGAGFTETVVDADVLMHEPLATTTEYAPPVVAE